MGMSNAIIRFGLDKGNSKKQVFTNGLLTILLGYGVLLLCWPLLQQVPGVAGYGVLLCIYVLTSCLRTLCTQFIRSREMNRLVGVDGGAVHLRHADVLCAVPGGAGYGAPRVTCWPSSAGTPPAACSCLSPAPCGATSISAASTAPCGGRLLRFSLPMIPAQISFWIINASDMFFVNALCVGYGGRSGTEWSGLLSTGYFLPTILTTPGHHLLRRLAAVRRHRGARPQPVLLQRVQELRQRHVLLCRRHPVALPPQSC